MQATINKSINKLFKNSKTTKRVVVVVFVAIFALACYYIVSSYNMYCEQTLSRLDAIAKTLSVQIDGNKHELLLKTNPEPKSIKTNEQNELYHDLHKLLAAAQHKNKLNTEISTLIYNSTEKQFYYVVNSSEKPYYLEKYSQNQAAFLKNYFKGGTIPQYKDKYGTWLTAISPIKDSNNKIVGIVEVDEQYDDFLDVIDKELYRKIGVALLIFSIIAFVLLRYLRQVLLGEETIKKELESSYELINQQNEDMLNSINYAKKIQTAFLPPNDLVKKYLPESFIFYLPKDIVSGDFYFFKEIEQGKKYIIAACDCTGHGVPGALMSVVGNNFLEHIINEGCYAPAQLLTRLNKSIINALKQDDLKSESRDGMDVGLCLIDKENNTITYAGANRPLYTIDNNEFSEIRGDKRPIGGLDNSLFEFTEHVFELNDTTQYYLFSDGYVDQFGGEKGKKYSTKRFKSLLLEIAKLPMHEQFLEIDKNYFSWKSKLEQTDDVLVIGFKP